MIPTSNSSEAENFSEAEMAFLQTLIQQGNFPSLKEFMKNPDQYRAKKEALFEAIDQSLFPDKHRLLRHRYFWRNTYEVKSLEKILKIAEDEGYLMNDLEMVPHKHLVHGTTDLQDSDLEISVEFWPKHELKALGGVVTNE